MSCTKVKSHIWWITSLATHVICLIAFMGVEIQWIANGHCNSKIELQIQLQNTFSFHSEAKICEEIVMVQVIGYVEDERCFNNLN
jgi:hypothetical protein